MPGRFDVENSFMRRGGTVPIVLYSIGVLFSLGVIVYVVAKGQYGGVIVGLAMLAVAGGYVKKELVARRGSSE